MGFHSRLTVLVGAEVYTPQRWVCKVDTKKGAPVKVRPWVGRGRGLQTGRKTVDVTGVYDHVAQCCAIWLIIGLPPSPTAETFDIAPIGRQMRERICGPGYAHTGASVLTNGETECIHRREDLRI